MAALSRCISAQPTLSRILRWNRSYASAAAAQLDYDFYSDDEDEHRKEWNCPVPEESESWVSGRGVQWVIIGDPMAKRHVYAERLSKLLNVPHISMGTLVRQELNPHSSLYKEIASAVNNGKLVPEHVIFGLLSKRLEEGCYSGKSGFILDGLPRTRVQAEILDEITDIDLVINLKSIEFLAKTDVGMGILSPSREFFRMGRSRFNLTIHSHDCHLNSSFNSDNDWKEKLRLHYEQIKPLEEYYRKQNKLLDFSVSRAPGDTWQGLVAALHLQHINAASSSQKLSA